MDLLSVHNVAYVHKYIFIDSVLPEVETSVSLFYGWFMDTKIVLIKSCARSTAASHAQASVLSRLNSINVGGSSLKRSSLSASTPFPSRTPTPTPYIPTLELPRH